MILFIATDNVATLSFILNFILKSPSTDINFTTKHRDYEKI